MRRCPAQGCGGGAPAVARRRGTAARRSCRRRWPPSPEGRVRSRRQLARRLQDAPATISTSDDSSFFLPPAMAFAMPMTSLPLPSSPPCPAFRSAFYSLSRARARGALSWPVYGSKSIHFFHSSIFWRICTEFPHMYLLLLVVTWFYIHSPPRTNGQKISPHAVLSSICPFAHTVHLSICSFGHLSVLAKTKTESHESPKLAT